MEINFEDIKLVKELILRKSTLLVDLKKVYDDTEIILNNRISKVFDVYTLHNINHSIRIMEYIFLIIDDINNLSDLEITILCYVAILHDVGMAVEESEIENIKEDIYAPKGEKFTTYLKYFNNNESLALQEFVRNIHAYRSAEYIRKNLINTLFIPGQITNNFSDEIASICQSHTENFNWITKNLKNHVVKGIYAFNPQYCACLLRLGDILDIDSQRTPYRLYEYIQPKGYSKAEWLQHFVISNINKIEHDINTDQKKIVFYGTCNNPSIHRKLLDYISWIERELNDSISLSRNMDRKYFINFLNSISNHIESVGYTFSNYKMLINFKSISNLLMGENIYGKKSLGLRELIQNSIDACRIREEEENKKYKFGDEKYTPLIKVILNKFDNSVIIKDNGCGMNHDIIKDHFLNIGISYYTAKEFKFKGYNYQPIGNYGIGFLACFMLSDVVKLKTRYYLSNIKYEIDLEKNSEYTSMSEFEDSVFIGTEIILNYNSFMEAFDNNLEKVQHFLESNFLTDDINLQLINLELETIVSINNRLSDINVSEYDTYTCLDVSKYIKGLHGTIALQIKKAFISKKEDIFKEAAYYVDNNLLIEIDSPDFREFTFENSLNYIEIPIINKHLASEYNEALDFFDDDYDKFERVLERFSWQIEKVNILLNKNQYLTLKQGEIDRGDTIFEGFNFYDLHTLDHDIDCPTYVSLKSIKVYSNIDQREVMPFAPAENNSLFSFAEHGNLYIRDILIGNYIYKPPYNASIFRIRDYKINATNDEILPNVSRNNLRESIKYNFDYTITKAIHKFLLTFPAFSPSERLLLKNFYSEYFKSETSLEL